MLGTPLGGTAETMGSYCGFQSGIMWSAGQDRSKKTVILFEATPTCVIHGLADTPSFVSGLNAWIVVWC